MLSPERSETKACICNQRALMADGLTAAITVINQPTVCNAEWKQIEKFGVLFSSSDSLSFPPHCCSSLPQEVEDDYIKNIEENVGSDETVDTTKDPCQNVKCSRHKVCVAQGNQRAMCVNRKKLEHRGKQSEHLEAHETSCKLCPVAASSPVCGSDGHNYASECKLEQQACLTGKELSIMCAGFCPCATAPVTLSNTDTKRESCTGQDLADLGDRLRDWFQLLHGNAKQNNSGKLRAGTASVLDKSLVASCKDSIGWMFSRLDTNSDLYLDQAELAAINLDKYEVCIRPFFNSCDSYKDGKVSTAEWCLCFWRESSIQMFFHPSSWRSMRLEENETQDFLNKSIRANTIV
ncbi:testican-2-like isoform X3 [Pseudoliparis swirei]|uniref:testican-2-like isoform X3 n=1 Tax=Pseudoliparis swirei TaxID=2059687 RepID=UPI0024BE16DF|nr:testican-2-like isoform X3 [Pseudoliparis swirei]